jgi:3-methyladenine DNA glycosylase AlkD
MEFVEALRALEQAGTEQNRKVYKRHGAQEPLFGVSFAELGRLQKLIKVDHSLARQLWQTDNHDARVLALQIADPSRLDLPTAESWLHGVRDYTVCGYLAKLIAASPLAREISDAWRGRHDEWDSACGWAVLALLAGNGADLDESWCEARIQEIENGLAAAPNRTRYEMNNALIALATVGPKAKKAALAAAKAIGKVHVDHGETNCKTPDAASAIAKVTEYRARRAGGASARAAVHAAKKKAAPKAAVRARAARPKPAAKPKTAAKRAGKVKAKKR